MDDDITVGGGGLDLTRHAPIEHDELEELKGAFELIDEVEDELTIRTGFQSRREAPEPPVDLSRYVGEGSTSDLSDEELGDLLVAYTGYASFLDGELARAKAAHKAAESNLKKIHAHLAVRLYAKKGITKAEVPTYVRDDKIYQEHEVDQLRAYMMKVALEAAYKAYSKQADAVSRLITLRQEEQSRTRREANLPYRGRPRNSF